MLKRGLLAWEQQQQLLFFVVVEGPWICVEDAKLLVVCCADGRRGLRWGPSVMSSSLPNIYYLSLSSIIVLFILRRSSGKRF